MTNKNFSKAINLKNDEFYTLYTDIENEINTYLDYDSNIFKNKTVLLPCDDPSMSNFTKYFFNNFAKLGLKKLISTCYAPPPMKSSSCVRIKDIIENNYPRGKIFEMTDSTTKEITWKYLEGNGDFRSKEITVLRDEADFIIANPPFSLFREFISWVNIGNKQFSVLGNMNAISYKIVFLLILKKQLWLGSSVRSGNLKFMIPDISLHTKRSRIDNTENKLVTMVNVRWFTNISNNTKIPFLKLMTMQENLECNSYMKVKTYKKYVNYDALEVPFVSAIPSDYDGIMGVPISFLDKYNPDQFEILGVNKKDLQFNVPFIPKCDGYFKVWHNGIEPVLLSVRATTDPMVVTINGNDSNAGTVVKNLYDRIFIRHKVNPINLD